MCQDVVADDVAAVERARAGVLLLEHLRITRRVVGVDQEVGGVSAPGGRGLDLDAVGVVGVGGDGAGAAGGGELGRRHAVAGVVGVGVVLGVFEVVLAGQRAVGVVLI